jgi:general secretion pathway protein K
MSLSRVRQVQAGAALVMVLWFVAAMSLMVVGIMSEAKLDIRLSQLYLRQAQVEALGDGAIQKAMLHMTEQNLSGEARPSVLDLRENIGFVEIHTRIRPVSGFIDPNFASEKLLHLMFERLAGMEAIEAEIMASKIVRWRRAKPQDEPVEPGLRYGRFEAPEDLLLVEGISKDIYDKISGAVSVSEHWEGGVNISTAPTPVLKVLADGDAGLVEQWQRAQMETQPSPVPEPFETELTSTALTSIYRVEARVRFPDNEVYRRVRWVEYGQSGSDKLPWRFFRTESVARVDNHTFSDT